VKVKYVLNIKMYLFYKGEVDLPSPIGNILLSSVQSKFMDLTSRFEEGLKRRRGRRRRRRRRRRR
jgi:hypothetical protein